MVNIFFDSNIWIYAFLETQKNESNKRSISLKLLEKSNIENIIISVQVLNEFHWTLKTKYNISEEEIRKKVKNGILEIAKVIQLDLSTYKSAYKIRDNYSISYWDSLIVTSALKNDCKTLYSEDMQHNQIIEDKLKIINPFKL